MNLIESVSEGFTTYSIKVGNKFIKMKYSVSNGFMKIDNIKQAAPYFRNSPGRMTYLIYRI